MPPVSNSLDPEQAWHFARPYLGPKLLYEKMPACDKNRH